MIEKLLHVKVSSGTVTLLVGVLAVVAFLIVRYFASRSGGGLIIDSQPDPFWANNPHLEYVDRFPRTAFRIARDRAQNRSFFIDLSGVASSVVRLRPCDAQDPELVVGGAIDLVCLDIAHPADVGTPFVAGVSFTVRGKQSVIAMFFRSLFEKRGLKVEVLEDSSRGAMSDGLDSHGDTVVHVAVQESFGTARVFVCWVR